MKWHKPSKKLPKKSGEYLIARNGTVAVLDYSAEYKVFNAYDWLKPAAADLFKIDVDYWAKMPKPPQED